MNLKNNVLQIYTNPAIDRDDKIQLLNDLLLDCYNEMEAQDQNMHPEVQHNTAEAFRLAKNLVRQLDEEESPRPLGP